MDNSGGKTTVFEEERATLDLIKQRYNGIDNTMSMYE